MIKYSEWQGFKRADFEFEGREAILIFPKVESSDGRWLYKTEYFGIFPELEIMMVERGYHLAYLANKTRWVGDGDIEIKDTFCAYLHDNFGLQNKCVPVGMSCGGMHAVYFAARFPERVAALFIDAPVLNYLSCPFALGDATDDHMIAEFLEKKGLTLSELINYRHHPIDEAHLLAERRIPLFISGGDSDGVVPYHENGAHLVKLYREHGAPYVERIVKGRGHHPHAPLDLSEVVEFIEANYSV